MKLLTYMFFCLSIFMLTTSCGSDDNSNCQKFDSGPFNLDVYDESVTLPGQVSLFFKAQTKAGQPLAGLTADDFLIFEKGRNDECFNQISTFESNARVSLNSQVFGTATMLVLDLSGSVIQGSLIELKQAATGFIKQIMPVTPNPSYTMGIWWFDGQDKLHQLSNLISDRNELVDIISNLNQSMTSDPSTDLYGAVIKSSVIADNVIAQITTDQVIGTTSVVIFTDGTDQAARHTKEDAINSVKNADKNISFYSIGLGNEIDKNVLSAIGKTAAIIADNKGDLEAKFIEASMLVFEEANSYYLFEYCSPKRDGSGVSELVIQLNHMGGVGSVFSSFDATGFEAGCQ